MEAVFGVADDILHRLFPAIPDALARHVSHIVEVGRVARHIDEGAAADRIMQALGRVLSAGQVRTRDLGGTASTTEFGDAIANSL